MKMKVMMFGLAALISSLPGWTQLMMTREATISFHSHTLLEDIDAENTNAMAVIDLGKNDIAFSCYMKQFEFPRKLMQQHFNENYVESDKFPKATFSGKYEGNVNLKKDGDYPVLARGDLTIHGVKRNVEIPATLAVSGNRLTGTATFKLNPSDYNISIPFIVRNKIEKENTVKVKSEWTLRN